jgi:hypothetical protein
MLWVLIALLLVRSVLLVRIVMALLLVCGRRVGRGTAIRIIALLVLTRRRGAKAVLRWPMWVMRRWRVGALSLRVRTVMSLTILVLGRVALLMLSIAMLLLWLLLVCAVMAVAVALTVALTLTVVILA